MGWWGGKDQTLSNLVSFFHFYRQDKGWCLAWGLTSRYYFGLCWLWSGVSTRDTSCSPRSKFLETPGKSTPASFASKAPSATRDRLLRYQHNSRVFFSLQQKMAEMWHLQERYPFCRWWWPIYWQTGATLRIGSRSILPISSTASRNKTWTLQCIIKIALILFDLQKVTSLLQ